MGNRRARTEEGKVYSLMDIKEFRSRNANNHNFYLKSILILAMFSSVSSTATNETSPFY